VECLDSALVSDGFGVEITSTATAAGGALVITFIIRQFCHSVIYRTYYWQKVCCNHFVSCYCAFTHHTALAVLCLLLCLVWSLTLCIPYKLLQGEPIPKDGGFRFPSWELKVLEAETMGIAEAIGFAVG